MSDNQNRDLKFDLAKLLAALWIVVWHVYDYNSSYRAVIVSDYSYMLTRVMLGVFMFSSGYFMSKYKFRKWIDIKNFYVKRFWRIYPLYAIAAISLFLCGFIGEKKVLLTTLTGLSTYVTPQPSTLWFVALLLSFYIITPLIFLVCERVYKLQIQSEIEYLFLTFSVIVLFSFLYWLSRDFLPFDQRLSVYFPIYCLGYASRSSDIFHRMINSKKSAVALIGIALVYFCLAEHFCTIAKFGFIIVGILGVLSLTSFLSGYSWVKSKFIYKLCYSTMCIYLFHRLWFSCADMLFEGTWYIPLWFTYLVIIPFTVIMGYNIQTMYDKLLRQVA